MRVVVVVGLSGNLLMIATYLSFVPAGPAAGHQLPLTADLSPDIDRAFRGLGYFWAKMTDFKLDLIELFGDLERLDDLVMLGFDTSAPALEFDRDGFQIIGCHEPNGF